jgi:pyruvate/2-oxoglutarate dehydrogenase complex dihydrolipoamide dehydrogenase (E3) component
LWVKLRIFLYQTIMLGCKFLVIGSGETGLQLSKELSQLGENVLLVEQDSFGGSYLHNMDIPRFWLEHESKKFQPALDIFRDFPKTYQTLLEYRHSLKQTIQEKITATYQYFLKDYHNTPNLRIIAGRASFYSQNLVEVSNGINSEYITFEHVILAIGKNTLIRPNLIPTRKFRFLHQYNVFQLHRVPATLAIVGFTPFNVEIADIYSSLGVAVEIFEKRSLQELMPSLNDLSEDYLLKFLSNRQVACHFETEILNLTQNDKTNITSSKGLQRFDGLFMYVKEEFVDLGLGLERVGINFDRKGIHTDIRSRTTLQNVWALGNCNSRTTKQNKHLQITDFLFKVRHRNSQIKLWDMSGFLKTNQIQKPFALGFNIAKPIYILGLGEQAALDMYKPDFDTEIIQKINREGFVSVFFRPSNGQILGCTLVGEMTEYRHYINLAMSNNNNALEVIRYILSN